MGAESFFFHLLPKAVKPSDDKQQKTDYMGVSELKKDEFISKVLHCIRRSELHRYDQIIVDNAVRITIHDCDGMLSLISVECRFSWYKDCIRFSYGLVKQIDNKIVRVRAYYPAYGYIDTSSETAFTAHIHKIQDTRKSQFNELFGDIEFRSLPGGQFYEKIKQRKSKTILNRRWQRPRPR